MWAKIKTKQLEVSVIPQIEIILRWNKKLNQKEHLKIFEKSWIVIFKWYLRNEEHILKQHTKFVSYIRKVGTDNIAKNVNVNSKRYHI